MLYRFPAARFAVLAALLLVPPVVAVATARAPQQSPRRLTVADYLAPARQIRLTTPLPRFRWDAQNRLLRTTRDDGAPNGDTERTAQIDPVTNTETPTIPADDRALRDAFARLPEINETAARSVAQQVEDSHHSAIARYQDDLYLWDAQRRIALRLTRTPDLPEGNAAISPDGQRVAFTRPDHNLYVIGVNSAGQVTPEIPLTRDGSGTVRNGVLDWVYEEELYGRGQTGAFRWSPDSKTLLFLRLDDGPVRPFMLVNHLPRQQKVETQFYPKAGDPNPIAELALVAADGKTAPRLLDLLRYPPPDRLIVRFGWSPDARHILFQVQNREQNWLDLNQADVETRQWRTLFRETTKAWVDALEEPLFLSDGTFLWQSDRDGLRRYYRYQPDGTLIGRLTSGRWNAMDIAFLDEPNQVLYVNGVEEENGAERHLWRVHLGPTAETAAAAAAAAVRLTEEPGVHRVQFSPDGRYFLDTFSSHAHPPEIRLHQGSDGALVRSLARSAPDPVYQLGTTKQVRFAARDGLPLDGLLILPPDYSPEKRYPVFCPVYGGPAAPQLTDRWTDTTGNLYYQMLAAQEVIVWLCDNRSATLRGPQYTWACYKQFGKSELSDVEDGVRYLINQGYADPKRIAIEGWSFGGYLVQYALTHSTLFSLGIAGAGVSDWHLYDTIYTERYLGTPQNNPGGYADSSCVAAAENLHGTLLLIHGTMDDNVHLQNTIQMVHALEKADKDYDLWLYPASGHGVGDPALSRQMRRRTLQYLLKNLQP